MNIKEAQAAIAAILDAIPDDELPKFDRVETEADGTAIAWWGGTGYHLGSATSTRGTGKPRRRPENYRDNATWSAIEYEMVYRADVKHLATEEAAS